MLGEREWFHRLLLLSHMLCIHGHVFYDSGTWRSVTLHLYLAHCTIAYKFWWTKPSPRLSYRGSCWRTAYGKEGRSPLAIFCRYSQMMDNTSLALLLGSKSIRSERPEIPGDRNYSTLPHVHIFCVTLHGWINNAATNFICRCSIAGTLPVQTTKINIHCSKAADVSQQKWNDCYDNSILLS